MTNPETGGQGQPAGEDRQRAMALVDEARQILYPEAEGDEPPTFDASIVFGDGELYRKSVLKYSESLEIWPACVEALIGRSASFYFLGDLEAAQADARRALALNPDVAEYGILAAPFQGEEAREILRIGMERAEAASFHYFMLWHDVASTYFYEGDFAAQATELEALISECESPESFHYLALGTAYQAMGDLARAEAIYEQALPHTADSLVRLRMQGDTEVALATLNRVRAFLEPEDVLVHGALIKALGGYPVPEVSEALEAVRRVGEANVFGVNGFAAGVLLLSSGNSTAGQSHLRDFLAMVESNPLEWGVTMRWRVDKARQLLAEGLPPSQ